MSNKVADTTYNVITIAESLKVLYIPYANFRKPFDEKKAIEYLKEIVKECEGVIDE